LRSYRFFNADLIGDHVQIFSLQQFLSQGLSVASQEIVAAARQTKANMVVLDGFQTMHDLETNLEASRQLLYHLGTILSLQDTTTLITAEASSRNRAFFPEMTTADVLIGLNYELEGVRAFRGLEVLKVRGQAALTGRHSLLLNEEGVQVFPRLEIRASRPAFEGLTTITNLPSTQKRAAFELKELDGLLGGGLTFKTSTLLTGSPGTGKTLLGLRFALAGVSRREPTLYLSFRETGEQLLQKAIAFGMGERFRAATSAKGGLLFQNWLPIELDPDRVANDVLIAIEQIGASRVVIDSILELERAVGESSGQARVPNYLAALLAILRTHGVTLLAIKETPKIVSTDLDFSTDAFSVLAENVLLLQQLAYRGQLHRVLSVLKMRFSNYDYTLREFLITSPEGIRVLTPDESGREVLAGLTEMQPDATGKERPPLFPKVPPGGERK
jgi:circadian clock protein KaiC